MKLIESEGFADEIKERARDTLERSQVRFSKRVLNDCAKRVKKGVAYLSERYTDWWKIFFRPITHVHVQDPKRSPVRQVPTAFGRQAERMEKARLIALAFAPADPKNETECAVLDLLWMEWISGLAEQFAHR